jgi:hypothetical protein
MCSRGALQIQRLEGSRPSREPMGLYTVEQVPMICKVAVGGCARQLQREIARFEAAGRGWREGWQSILVQLGRRDSVRAGARG